MAALCRAAATKILDWRLFGRSRCAFIICILWGRISGSNSGSFTSRSVNRRHPDVAACRQTAALFLDYSKWRRSAERRYEKFRLATFCRKPLRFHHLHPLGRISENSSGSFTSRSANRRHPDVAARRQTAALFLDYLNAGALPRRRYGPCEIWFFSIDSFNRGPEDGGHIGKPFAHGNIPGI